MFDMLCEAYRTGSFKMIQSYKHQFKLLSLIFSLSCSAVWAQQATPNPALTTATTTTNSPAIPDEARYRIGPGDVLDIRIYNRPTLSRDGVRVEGNGKFRMPL